MLILGFIVFTQVNPLIAEMVGKVNPDTILANVQRLQDFVDRSWWFDSCYAAADWLRAKLLNYGLDTVYYDTVIIPPPVPPNVIGIQRGFNYPDSVYNVICAHFDAINEETPETLAPGADDNASGVAAVLEVARILKDYRFECNIRFILLSAEEGSMAGSRSYCFQADGRGDDIRVVLNADMLGYTDYLPESLEVCGDTLGEPLVDFFIACSDTYTTTLTRKRIGSPVGDGGIFSHYGWLTTTLIEDVFPESNPYKHTPADTIGAGFNDLPFCVQSIRSIIAALASQTRPLGIMESRRNHPVTKELHVWPNPMVRTGILSYSVDADSRVSIKIYSVDGRYVSTLWDGYKRTGLHKCTINVQGMPQGVYFIHFDINGHRRNTSIVVSH